MEVFEKIAELGGRILKVDRSSPAGGDSDDEMRAAALLLTFDVARVLVTVREGRGLELHRIESPDEVGLRLCTAGEDEPWWRVLGSPLSRISSEEAEGGGQSAARLQFRGDEDDPRFITLRIDGGLVRARVEKN